MRKISAGLFISLDGVVEFPERWGFRYMDKDMSEAIVAGIAQADAVLLGPATYRIFAGMWPRQSDHVPMARFLNHSPKYVVSRTPDGDTYGRTVEGPRQWCDIRNVSGGAIG